MAPARPVETRQRVAWGSVWAGLLVALATYVLLELFIFAAGLREVSIDADVNEGAILSGFAAVIAFFVGGLVASATTSWRSVAVGVTQGLMVWALAIVTFLLLSVLGSGLALGTIGTGVQQIGGDLGQITSDVDAQSVTDDAREAAAIALLFLGLTVAAAITGGVAGARLGSRSE